MHAIHGAALNQRLDHGLVYASEIDAGGNAQLLAGNGNVLAFFELPTRPDMDRDRNTPEWVQHLAFELEDYDALLAAKEHVEAQGIDVIGPTNHGIFQSIYFFDPNGHRLELVANTQTQEQLDELQRVAPAMLEEWSQTKKAPRHAAWLHELEFTGGEQ